MRSFLADFHERVDEVNIYFNFLQYIDQIETHRKEQLVTDSGKIFLVQRNLQKILRAKSFLLLYNLVEASIKNGIVETYDAIKDDGLSYENLSDKFKEIWLSGKMKSFKSLTDRNFKDALKNTFNDLLNFEEISLDNGHISISGNLDFKQIDSILNRYGFYGSFVFTDKKSLERALYVVKQQRNFLAHGNISFKKSAEAFAIQDLIMFKDLIIHYLTQVVEIIDKYIENKKYKK